MKIRVATKAAARGRRSETREDAEYSVEVEWVEFDGHRVEGDCTDASVVIEAGQVCQVTLTFDAAAEMVLLDADGEIIE